MIALWCKYRHLGERYWYVFIALAILVLFVDTRIPNGPLSGAIAFIGGILVASGVIGTMRAFSGRKQSS